MVLKSINEYFAISGAASRLASAVGEAQDRRESTMNVIHSHVNHGCSITPPVMSPNT
jgi:hypothetical protein